MTANTLDLAKQGNPVAIAAMINHLLGNKGVTARATGYHKRLIIFVEYQANSKRDTLVNFLKNSLINLQPKNIAQVTIRGSAVGHTTDAWRESFELSSSEQADTDGISDHSLVATLRNSSQFNALASSSTNSQSEILGFGILTVLLIVNAGLFFNPLRANGVQPVPATVNSPCDIVK
jgi:hypothetical protein